MHLIKEHVLEEYSELLFTKEEHDNINGLLRIYRMHPFVKYIAQKTISLNNIKIEQRIALRNPHIFYTLNFDAKD